MSLPVTGSEGRRNVPLRGDRRTQSGKVGPLDRGRAMAAFGSAARVLGQIAESSGVFTNSADMESAFC